MRWTRLSYNLLRAKFKSTVKNGRETVNTSEVNSALGVTNPPVYKYELITSHELESAQMHKRLVDDWDV